MWKNGIGCAGWLSVVVFAILLWVGQQIVKKMFPRIIVFTVDSKAKLNEMWSLCDFQKINCTCGELSIWSEQRWRMLDLTSASSFSDHSGLPCCFLTFRRKDAGIVYSAWSWVGSGGGGCNFDYMPWVESIKIYCTAAPIRSAGSHNCISFKIVF